MVHAAEHEGEAADADDGEQQADRADVEEVGGGDAHGGEERHSGKNAQHSAGDIQAGIGGGVLLPSLAHHAGDAVLRFKRLLFQKFIGLGLGGAGEEDGDADGDHHEQHTQSHARGGVFGDAEARYLAHSGEQDQTDGGEDAEHRGERYFRRGGAAQGKVFGRLRHRHAAQGRVAALGRGLLLGKLVLEQEVGRHAEQTAHLHDLIHIGHGLRALPLAHGLARDAELLRQLLLRPAGLFAQGSDLISQYHKGSPPIPARTASV